MVTKCSACGGDDLITGSYADYVEHPDEADALRYLGARLIQVTVQTRICRECGATTDTGDGVCERNVLSGSLGCNCTARGESCALLRPAPRVTAAHP